MGFILIIVVVILIVLLIRFYKNNYHFHYDFMTFFQGGLGSGKTTMLVYHALKLRRRRVIKNWVKKYLLFFIRNKKYDCVDIYSTFPIFINKKVGFCKIINYDLFTWAYKLPNGAIVVVDELGYLMPSESKMTERRLVFTLTWLRQCTDARIFGASQSFSEVNITLRRKVNNVYQLSDINKGWFWSSIHVMNVYLSEDINTVYEDSSKDFVDNVFRFRLKDGHFASDYGKDFYNYDSIDIDKVSLNYNAFFKLKGYKNGEQWQSLYY